MCPPSAAARRIWMPCSGIQSAVVWVTLGRGGQGGAAGEVQLTEVGLARGAEGLSLTTPFLLCHQMDVSPNTQRICAESPSLPWPGLRCGFDLLSALRSPPVSKPEASGASDSTVEFPSRSLWLLSLEARSSPEEAASV